MSESTKNPRDSIFPFPMARKGFRTLSLARQKEIFSQLRSKTGREEQAKNSLISSPESTQPKRDSASLLIHLKNLPLRLKILPKVIILWASIKITRMLLNWRNKVPKILEYPDKRLKLIAKPVDFNKTTFEERAAVVRKMGMALKSQTWGEKQGIAAPQIGIGLRVMVVRGNVMFNPEWTPTKAPTESMIEACYSVPGKTFQVDRAKYGWAKWTNIDGKPFEDKISGLPAIVFQHEIDHLNGICCADIGKLLDE